jgi:hypothetical protein
MVQYGGAVWLLVQSKNDCGQKCARKNDGKYDSANYLYRRDEPWQWWDHENGDAESGIACLKNCKEAHLRGQWLRPKYVFEDILFGFWAIYIEAGNSAGSFPYG